jgi:diphthine synthase
MGKLTFVGLGLGPKGVSLEGLEEIRNADEAYLEYYTSPHDPTLVGELERWTGRNLTIVDRIFVEDGKAILTEAKTKNVVIAVQGDPMVATTHNDLRVRATKAGIQTRVIHASTIGAAAASASGLHFYKFSRTVTITRESVQKLTQAYNIIHENLLEGAHTLLLLEYDVERGEGITPNDAIRGLLSAEANFKRGIISNDTFALVISRVGQAGEDLRAGRLSDLESVEFGGPPHCIVVPGKLHFTEVESIAAIFSLREADVKGNSESVKRTAETLVPKYVAKTRKALDSVKDSLGERYEPVVENVQLYLKDAEEFLSNGEDELAMLSIGYAEGLLDSLNFAGVVRIDW